MMFDPIRRILPDKVRRSYVLKFGLAFLFLGTLVGSIGYLTTTEMTAAVERNVMQEHATVAAEEGRNFRTWHEQNKRLTGVLTATDVVRNRDPEAIQRHLRQQLVFFPDATHSIDYVNTTNNRILAGTREVDTLQTADFPDSSRVNTNLDPAEPLVTEPYLINNKTLVISYVRPVSGQPERAIILTMDLGAYGQNFRTHGRSELTLVVDSANRIIMSDEFDPRYGVEYGQIFERLPDQHGILQTARSIDPGEDPSGAMEVGDRPSELLSDGYGFNPDGYVVGYYYFPDQDWVLLFYQSTVDSYGFVRAVQQYGTLVTVVSVLLIGVVGAILGRNTAVAVDRLTRKAGRIESGDFDVDFETNRIDNIGQLYRAFNEMQCTIREHLRASALIDNASDLITQVDENGDITFQSPSSHAILGYDPEQMDGTPLLSYVHPDDKSTVDSALSDDENPRRIEFRMQDADGDWRVLEGTCEKVTDNPFVTGVVVTCHDITDRIERQAELEETKRELERSNEALQQFAYIASHDLQEPLRMVSSYLDLLSSEYGDRLDEEANEYIEFAVDGAERMRNMIDGLLTYSRVKTRAGDFEPIDPNEVIDDVCLDLKLLIENEDATITTDSFPTIRADENQLRQVFQNLIKNAIEHAGEDPPEIHIGFTELPDAYRFSVEDNGVGIPENQQEKIFEIFEQASGEESGTGIGLAVCKRIVERHGGDIWVESSVGKQTTFYFTISKQN
ncbi:PAS domain S-box [Halogeometricum borinquense DSM 11551]|uniref:histidine kinase n=2 Tax=Halogeometricum borinquense (strain ATCC 700274 / DSM 11551 / JCM 10706 / KCTC 4070 / PR3) TaxID=469382 RepID=L9UN34_HALBP|nr:ATP-binding protein [Halogeometricum borinquense]ELY25573.1 PAS domain S-box [Halogeometricum borinquense DSM 11551]